MQYPHPGGATLSRYEISAVIPLMQLNVTPPQKSSVSSIYALVKIVSETRKEKTSFATDTLPRGGRTTRARLFSRATQTIF